MGDIRDRVRQDLNSLQKLMAAVPGFQGYHEQAVRQSADKVLRDHLVGLLVRTMDRLNQFSIDMVRENKVSLVGEIDRTRRRMMRAHDRIQHASHGYSGFFAAVKVDVTVLDRMYDYDLSMREVIGAIENGVSELRDAADTEQEKALRKLGETVDELLRMLDARDEVARGINP